MVCRMRRFLTYKRDGKKYDITYTADSEKRYMLGFYYMTEGEPQIVPGDDWKSYG